jgi:hypothetical protein
MLWLTRTGDEVPRRRRVRMPGAWPRTWRVRVACLVGLLVVLLIAADRAAAWLAADVVADRLACTAGLTSRPSVRFGGGPFLPQAADGRFTDVDVSAHDVRRRDITIATVHAHLRGVSLPVRNRVDAAQVRIDLTVGYAALPAEVGGWHVSYRAANGMLAADTTLTVAGRQIPVTVLLEPTLNETTMTIEPRGVELFGMRRPLGALPPGSVIGSGFSRTLPALPTGLRYQSLTVTDNGLRLTVGGDNITAIANANSCGGNRSPSN